LSTDTNSERRPPRLQPGRKFNKIYEVYRQRFQRDDFGEDEPFDPQVLPNSYLTNPQPKHAFVYVCAIQRMAINLFGRNALPPAIPGER
jgi:type I restriction enzyme, R subunit